MNQETWNAMTPVERAAARDLSGLNPKLEGWEGWRVEVTTVHGETRRFIVGRSTGWKPCHIELFRRGVMGGPAADREYKTVRPLYRTKP